MSDRDQRETGSEASPDRADDAIQSSSRRNFSKLGLGAPVLMTLASRPVYGMECLSGILSMGTASHVHQDTGQCTEGMSVSALQAAGMNMGRAMGMSPDTKLRDTVLYQTTPYAGEMPYRKIVSLLNKGTRLQQLGVAALMNCHLNPTFVLNEIQLVQLLNDQLNLPPHYSKESLLEYIMPE